ncbi:hypothetical protein Y888_03085 [Mixta calida B021323]|nr:hypothetical protein Y888_03085 [Mixta calida B021323]
MIAISHLWPLFAGLRRGNVAAESIKPGEKLLFCAQLTPDMGVIHCQERYA